MAAREGAGREIQMNRGIGVLVDGKVALRGAKSREGVGPGAAGEYVTAQAAGERVPAPATRKVVVAALPLDPIVAVGAVQDAAVTVPGEGVGM